MSIKASVESHLALIRENEELRAELRKAQQASSKSLEVTLPASIAFDAMFKALVATEEDFDEEAEKLSLSCPVCSHGLNWTRPGVPCAHHLRVDALELARKFMP
jgi:hypothetical protein